MHDVIEKYENLASIPKLRDTLIEIGNLAGGEERISFNDDDKESFYIRNKFGYIQRNKENRINSGGIYFEKLYHLEILFEVENSESSEESSNLNHKLPNFLNNFESNQSLLENDLKNLKQKIEFILDQECEFIAMKNDELAQKVGVLRITKSTNPSIPGLIKFSTQHYEQLVLRRIAKELNEFTATDFKVREDRYYFARVFTIIGELLHELNESKKIEEENALLKAFKTLDHIRSKLLHNHRFIRFGVAEEKNEIEINEIIRKLIEHLRSVVKEDVNEKIVVDSNETEIANELKDISKSLLKIIEAKSTINVKNSKKSRKIEVKKADNLKTTKELKTLIFQACLELKNHNLIDTVKLEQLNGKYQIIFQLLDAQEQENYPKNLSICESEDIIEFQEKIKEESDKKKLEINEKENELKMLKEQQKIEKVAQIIPKIVDEIEYLKEVKINKAVKQDHIVQHIVSVIGQYMRDIQKGDTQSYFPSISSALVAESFISVKRARSQGLAHNIFSLNLMNIANKVDGDVLPVYDHFQSIFTVYESHNKKIPISLLTMNELGLAFHRLGFYDEAVDCFKKLFKHIKANPGQTDARITQENVTVIDGCQFFCGVESFEFKCRYNLAKASISAGYCKNALEVLESLISDVKISDLSFLPEEKKKFSELYCTTACCLAINNENQKAIDNFDIALMFSNHLSNLIKIGLATCYSKLNEHEKAVKLVEDALRNPNLGLLSKFYALESYSSLLSYLLKDKELIEKMTEIVNKMNSLMQKERNFFRKELGEDYFSAILALVQIEVNLIFEKLVFAIETNMTSEFEELQKELEVLNKKSGEITKKFKQGLVHDKLVKLYTTFALCFSTIATHSNINSDNYSKMIEKAHQFLTNTIEIVSKNIIFKLTAEHFLQTYTKISLTHVGKTEGKIDCLKKILKMQEQYDLDKSYTLFYLGSQHHYLADCYINGENNYKESFDEAFLNYKKAKENFTKILENGEIQLETKALGEFYKWLAMSYTGLGCLRFDLKSMLNSVMFYKIALEQKNLSFDQQKEIEKQLVMSEKKYVEMKNFLESILTEANAISQDQMNKITFIKLHLSEVWAYALHFFFEAININLEVKDKDSFAISLKNKSTINSLKAHLNQELNLNQNLAHNAVTLQTEKLSQNDSIIKTAIMTQFSEINNKISKDCKNVEIEVSTKGLKTEDLKDFCQSNLGIYSEDLEFFDSSCWISLNEASIATLRKKL